MKKDDKPIIPETPKISSFIAGLSVVGLTIIVVVSFYEQGSVPLVLYAIFGAGILGSPAIVEILRTVFRLDK